MLELLVVGASLFGDGHWRCTYQYDYPQRKVKETFVSDVHYADDLSYIASNKIIYSHIDKKFVFAQFSYDEKGTAHVSGNTFYLHGYAYNVRKDFDHLHHFSDDYTEELFGYLNTTLPNEDKLLTVIEKTDKTMVVKHKKSGTLTQCTALTRESD